MGSNELAVIKRILERERQARKTAEKLLEAKSLELYAANQELKELADSLEQRVKKRTSELEEARLVAESAASVKAAFLANMSHEIRTPLNGIIGINNLLLGEELNPKQFHYVESVNESAELLLTLINDILDFSKVEAGKLELEVTEFLLSQVIDRTVEILNAKASNEEIEFYAICSPELPDRVKGDPSRLQQILINLLDNAIKFTSEGSVTIRIYLLDTGSEEARIEFLIEDTGIGMSDSTLSELFKPFTQAEESTSRRFGGTGLGLAIVKNLVELMGGEISVESTVGRGSRFSVRLPFAVSKGARKLEMPLEGSSFTCYLSVESALLRESLTNIFKAEGISRVEIADFSDWQRIANNDERTLWIVSVESKNGELRELNEWLRKLPNTISPLILSSSPGSVSQKLGDQIEFVPIPFSRKQLLRRVCSVMGIRYDLESSLSGHAEALRRINLGSMHLLLAEDNVINQQVSTEMLAKLGARVDVAANGYEVLKMLQMIPYDLVLMDIRMPEMGGIEACTRIRAHGNDIPIIALTANAMKGDKEKFIEAGMNDYISKPLMLEPLIDALTRQLGGRVEPKGSDDIFAESEVIMDLEGLVSSLGGNREMAEEVIQEFCSQCSKIVSEGLQHLGGGNFDAAASLFHRFAGGASAIRAVELAQAAIAIEETLLSDPENSDRLTIVSERFKKAMGHFSAYAIDQDWMEKP